MSDLERRLNDRMRDPGISFGTRDLLREAAARIGEMRELLARVDENWIPCGRVEESHAEIADMLAKLETKTDVRDQ